MNGSRIGSRQALNGSSKFLPTTGRKIYVTVTEGKNLVVKDRLGKSDPFVKLQYGKVQSFSLFLNQALLTLVGLSYSLYFNKIVTPFLKKILYH